MASFTLAPVKYGKVVGRFVAKTGDGVDADVYPDDNPVTGTVTFTPSVKKVLVATGQPDPFTAELLPITATIDSSGYLSFNGQPGVWLAATNDTSMNPSGWTYKVTYNLTYSSAIIDTSTFDIQVPAADPVTGPFTDLAVVAPVPSSTGAAIVQGPAGPAGPANTLTIGSVTTGTAAASITGTSPNQVLNLVLPNSGGAGTVKSVNGVAPDGAGNVVVTAAGVGAYVLPGTGIPKSDMASAVQASLNKADSATQGGYVIPVGGIPSTTMTAAVQTSLGRADTSVQQTDNIVYYRRYSSGAWPVRGSIPTGSSVEWVGPTAPPIDGTYALAGVDTYVVTVS